MRKAALSLIDGERAKLEEELVRICCTRPLKEFQAAVDRLASRAPL